MKFTLEIDCDNTTFDESPATEVARILRETAGRVEEGVWPGNLRDSNGNTVGSFRFFRSKPR
jgi:hypothetical protein